ncbi:MAG TPA: hypothetical protein VM487_26355 [Phycisphaerae bacterium]|nr:hypothetical protein [Phycisphaerae bacterium]
MMRIIGIGLLLFGLLAALVWALIPSAEADERHMADYHSDPEFGAWLKGLKRPGNGLSCCSLNDCRRTEAEWRDGRWWAVVERHDRSEWEAIPPDVVLDHKAIDEFAYVCNGSGGPAHENYSSFSGVTEAPAWDGQIYCFVPPLQGF